MVHIVVAYMSMAYIGMAYVVMAHIVVVNIVMVCRVMAYMHDHNEVYCLPPGPFSSARGRYSYGVHSHGRSAGRCLSLARRLGATRTKGKCDQTCVQACVQTRAKGMCSGARFDKRSARRKNESETQR